MRQFVRSVNDGFQHTATTARINAYYTNVIIVVFCQAGFKCRDRLCPISLKRSIAGPGTRTEAAVVHELNTQSVPLVQKVVYFRHNIWSQLGAGWLTRIAGVGFGM